MKSKNMAENKKEIKTKDWIERSEYVKKRVEESRERRKKSLQKVLKSLSKIWNGFIICFWILIKIFFIGLISGLAGQQSVNLIYHLNKPLGMGYALLASYIESGLIGVILYSYIFRGEK